MPSRDLAAFVVWDPELGAHRGNVPEGMALIKDSRALHYWDANEVVGRAYQRTLPTPGPAWDVYLLFRRGVKWIGAMPPRPDYWMHQLSGVTNAPHLDPDILLQHVEQLLRT